MRLLLALLLVAPAVSAQTERIARLDSALVVLHDDGLFDGALIIGEGDEAAYRFGAGGVTPETPLYLASVSKMMTATAILSLVEDGALGLDDPVGQHLQPWAYPGLTVRHLLSQTSGLHTFATLQAHRDTTRPVTTADYLAILAEHRPPLHFEPGSAYAYSNANFAVLAALAEAVDGRPFAEVMRARVFGPAGMDSARIALSGEEDWIAWVGGDGAAVHASAEDVWAFERAWSSGRLVSDETVRLAELPIVLSDGSASPYALGRFLTDAPLPLVGHFGDGLFTKTGLWREREAGTTYVILMAGDAIHRTAILTAVIQIWNGLPFELPQARPVADVPVDVLVRHVGMYSSGFGRLHITLEDGQLHLEPEGAGGSEPLIPASEATFYFGHQDLTWEFVTDESGRTVGVQLQGQPETFGAREE